MVVGVTGASGALYGAHFLRALTEIVPGESSLIISPAALRVYREESESKVDSVEAYLDEVLSPAAAHKHSFTTHDHRDIGAKPASGSTPRDGMVVVPCSMKSVAAICHGYTTNLIERAADVSLKERRKLVLVPRETPYNLVHLRNMTALTEAGAVILPASPGFYQLPRTMDDLGRFIAGRILSLFGVEHSLFKLWKPDE